MPPLPPKNLQVTRFYGVAFLVKEMRGVLLITFLAEQNDLDLLYSGKTARGYFYIAILSRIKILEHIMFDSLEAKENHLADISARNSALKGTDSSQTSVMFWRGIYKSDNHKN